MQYTADLHVHGKYSRAVSQDMVLPKMAEWARKKGIDILTTSDWTHPLWQRELKSILEEKEEGLYRLKEGEKKVQFILTTEISSIYSQGGKLRRIHNLIFSPSLETCENVSRQLLKKGCNLSSDGRPIIGLSSKDLLELVLSVDERCILIPCHVWTPWFSLYGSKSGFASIEECFGNYSKYIYGVETGLSSDPEMNWRIKELDNRSILSSSDAHSPAKMGREATVFELERPNYENIVKAIKPQSIKGTTGTTSTKGNKALGTPGTLDTRGTRILYTIEFYPEEGKYHYTGHRNCKVVHSPKDSKEKGIICPNCKRELTVGVMHQIEEMGEKIPDDSLIKIKTNDLGVKWIGDPRGNHPPFVKIVPLLEVVSESLSSTTASQKVKDEYEKLCSALGSEFNILLRTKLLDIEKAGGPKIAEGIRKVRSGDIVVEPGFDGEYGKVKIWQERKKEKADEKLEVKVKKQEPQLSMEF